MDIEHNVISSIMALGHFWPKEDPTLPYGEGVLPPSAEASGGPKCIAKRGHSTI